MGKKPAETKASKKDLSTKGIYKEKANRAKIIKKVIMDHIKKNKPKNSFVMHDMQSLSDRVEIWRHHIPRVECFYAVKAMFSTPVVKHMVAMGTGFDVASVSEMELCMKNGANPNDLIFANPVKQDTQILATKKLKVKKMTFDCIEELQKIHRLYPEAECILRIATVSTGALYNLSEKFGAAMENVDEILKEAKKLNLHIKGVAFHTGSGGVSFESYEESLRNIRKIFDKAEEMGLKKMDFLDIGGGFTLINPEEGKNFTDVAKLIEDMLNKVFPEKSTRIIAEPGRYMAESVQYVVS